MFDNITMDTIELTWEEKVCCYFFREICDFLSVKVFWDARQKKFIVRNYRVSPGSMEEYFWEENWSREFYQSLLDIYVELLARNYTRDIERYLEAHDWEEWHSRLQWCKVAKQFLENDNILNMLDGITYDRAFSIKNAYIWFNLEDVEKLLREVTVRDKKYLYVW